MSKKQENTIHYRIKRIRFELDLKKCELAKKLNVSASTIGRYESNERVPDYVFLENLVIELKVNPAYVFGQSEVIFLEEKIN